MLKQVVLSQKYLRPIVMPGLPMDYGLMAGLMVRSFKDAVRFQNGIYPENQVASAPVGDYLKALWDPRSEALILYVLFSDLTMLLFLTFPLFALDDFSGS